MKGTPEEKKVERASAKEICVYRQT